MSEPQPPSSPSSSSEIPLEDIDRLLESEDPEFTKSLVELRAVESATGVTIDAAAIDESMVEPEKFEDRPATRFARIKLRVRTSMQNSRARLKARMIVLAHDSWIFLRTQPKEFFFYSLSTARILLKQALLPIRAYQNANRIQKIMTLILISCAVGSAWVLLANFKGVWLPQINEPILRSFEPYADRVDTFDPKDLGESFYSAFPQERYEFLFPKMKTNLRRTADNPNPMGAFEVIVLLDSKDTAIEVRDRQIEFFDQMQRVFEEESFGDLESELGKSRLKSRIKRDLNQKLTQGWVKDINFKNFILKP